MVSPGIASAERLAVLCGPTAVGKTALAVELALRLGAEIICADSRTVYRGMDIGTAKPTRVMRSRVPHHLLDIVEPTQAFTLADFQRLAKEAIADVRARGGLPLVVGGTGLYIRAIVDDLAIPAVPPDHRLRAALEAEERIYGPGYLHARLATLDPVAASRVHPHNLRRVIRALEVAVVTGRPISALQGQGGSTAAVTVVGLTMERAQLYHRIDARVEAQLEEGLVDETRRQLASGVPVEAPAMAALGYKELVGWLQGAYAFSEAVRRLKRNTRRYASRQLTWFRRDPRIRWVDATHVDAEALAARVHAIMDATC